MGLLPDKPSIPAQNFSEYFTLIFGEGGIGKTTFAIQPENTILIQFEEGDKGLSCYKVNLIEEAKNKYGKDYKGHVWTMFINTIEELEQGEHNFNHVAVDSADRAYDFKMAHFKAKEGRHPSGGDDYGQGWNQFNSAYKDSFYRLKESDYGLTVIAHAKTKEIENVRGDKRDKIIPAVGGKMGSWLLDEADIVLFYDRNIEGDRVLRVESDGNYEAKQRLSFPVDNIPAGNSAKETFENFKVEFEKAIQDANEKYNVTQEMIDEYYQAKENKGELKNLLQDIKDTISNKEIKTKEALNLLEEKCGVDKLSKLDYEQAKKYKELLENVS
ncbi:MAG: ATP-binding protein [Bacillota bacterium]